MKIKKTKRGFRVDFYHPVYGHRTRKVLKARTEAEARAMAEKLRVDILQTEGLLPRKQQTQSLDKAIEIYFQEKSLLKSKKSQMIDYAALESLRKQVGKVFVAELKLGDITSLIRGWQDESGFQVSSVNRYLNTIKSFLGWSHKKEWIRNDVSKQIKHLKGPVRESRPIGGLELLMVFETASPSLKLQIEIAVSTGLRAGEVASLSWASIDFDRNTIKVGGVAGFMTKNGRSKLVFLPSELRKRLLELKLKSGSCPWLFPNKAKTGPIKSEIISKAWGRARRKARVDDVKFHDLRATAAVNFAELGLGDAAIAKLLGHETPQMARKYSSRINDLVLREATEGSYRKFSEAIKKAE